MTDCVDIFKRQAMSALENRKKLVTELRSVESDSSLSDAAKRTRVERLDRDIMRLEAEARDAVERGEREAKVRSLAGGLSVLTPAAPLPVTRAPGGL